MKLELRKKSGMNVMNQLQPFHAPGTEQPVPMDTSPRDGLEAVVKVQILTPAVDRSPVVQPAASHFNELLLLTRFVM
jgi:hypothetical protein